MDVGQIAIQRLTADGLIGMPVRGIHVVEDGTGADVAEISISDVAPEAQVTLVASALAGVSHRIVRRSIGTGVSYREQSDHG